MIVDIRLRRRPVLEESLLVLNAGFVQAFVSIPNFWAVGKQASDAPFHPGDGECATLDLRKSLIPGLTGQIGYMARFAGYLDEDVAASDDFLLLYLNTDKADYAGFCAHVLPRLIESFRPYRIAAHTDKNVRRTDWQTVIKQRKLNDLDIDGRASVLRIWPVSFFDDLLCHRSFGIGAEEVVRRASIRCERAEIINNGAFLIVTSDLVVGSALDELNAEMMSLLRSD